MKTAIMAAALAVLTMSAVAGEAEGEYVYMVRADGRDLGECRITEGLVDSDGAVEFHGLAKTKLRAKALFVTVFSLDAEESWVCDEHGLRRYESHTEVDGVEISVEAERRDEALVVDVAAEGEHHSETVPLETFDLTSAESAGERLRDAAGEVVLNVLDFDELTIVETRFEPLGEETLKVDEVDVPCRTYGVRAGVMAGRKWYAVHDASLLIKEEGEDEDGEYRFELKRVPEGREAVLSGRNMR